MDDNDGGNVYKGGYLRYLWARPRQTLLCVICIFGIGALWGSTSPFGSVKISAFVTNEWQTSDFH